MIEFFGKLNAWGTPTVWLVLAGLSGMFFAFSEWNGNLFLCAISGMLLGYCFVTAFYRVTHDR